MSLEAIFVRAGERFTATELARGPWDRNAQHGGAPAALLAQAIEGLELGTELQLARLTCEFVRPVPLGELEVDVSVVRPGRRVTLVEGVIRDGSGTVVTQARAQLLRVSDVGPTVSGPPPFAGPGSGRANDFPSGDPMFATHGMEIRFVEGGFREVGPATAWFRLRAPLVAGSQTSAEARAAAAADFGNGIASAVSWGDHLFINPDLTLYLERPPRGEWVAMQSETRIRPGFVAVSDSLVWDEEGLIGRAMQSLLVQRLSPDGGTGARGATSGGRP
jgi:acyl-coenzyme A thioesterase PaaI-like protein